jgi:hypothetical protein
MKNNLNHKQVLRKKRHQFLLTFFDPETKYQVKEVNGYILVKFYNKSNSEWEVAIYTKGDFNKVEEWKKMVDSQRPML